MILPTKHVREDEALIGVGATLLSFLSSSQPLSDFWDAVKNASNVGTFERFILALDMLFMLGLVTLEDNKIRKVSS